jgi:hypothetical protein
VDEARLTDRESVMVCQMVQQPVCFFWVFSRRIFFGWSINLFVGEIAREQSTKI